MSLRAKRQRDSLFGTAISDSKGRDCHGLSGPRNDNGESVSFIRRGVPQDHDDSLVCRWCLAFLDLTRQTLQMRAVAKKIQSY